MSAANPAASFRQDATVISVVGFAHGTSHFFHFVIPPLFPWLMREFGLTFTQVGAIMSTFFVVSGIGQALAGFAVDRFGGMRVLCAGVGLLSLGGLAYASAQSYPMLLVAAAIAGVGNCVFHPADYTIMNRRVSATRLGHAFSVHGLSGNLGWAAAPVFVIAIAEAMGWRAACVGASMVGFAALAFLLVRRSDLDDAARSIKLFCGIIADADITDTFELARGQKPGRQNDREITLFKSGGGGHEDLGTAQHLLARLESASKT